MKIKRLHCQHAIPKLNHVNTINATDHTIVFLSEFLAWCVDGTILIPMANVFCAEVEAEEAPVEVQPKKSKAKVSE